MFYFYSLAIDNFGTKLRKFVDTYETLWKSFCDYSKKDRDFTENDVTGFFETLIQRQLKPSTCSIYR